METSEADWEGRLKGAVDSAEQWNAFADKLAAERTEVDAELAAARADAQARLIPYFLYVWTRAIHKGQCNNIL